MKKNTKTLKTIETKLYQMPGEFFIDVRESGRGYTDFYLYNAGYGYATRIYRVKKKELPEDLDRFVAQLFLDNFIRYFTDVDYEEELYLFENFQIEMPVEDFKKYIENRIEKGEYFAHSERVIAIYELGTAWAFEISDHFQDPGYYQLYVSHKDRPGILIDMDSSNYDFIGEDIVKFIDNNSDEFIDDYKYSIDRIFNKDI